MPPSVSNTLLARGKPALLLVLAGLAALAIDLPLAQFIHNHHLPGGLSKLFNLAEVFGHGIGVALILFTLGVALGTRCREIFRAAATAYGSGLVADLGKTLIERARPSAADLAGGVSATFGDWFPGFSAGYAQQGFPSAHVATAMGLAIGLTAIVPRGGRAFAGLVLLVACQRITNQAHFLSDCCFGAAVGALVGNSICRLGAWNRGR